MTPTDDAIAQVIKTESDGCFYCDHDNPDEIIAVCYLCSCAICVSHCEIVDGEPVCADQGDPIHIPMAELEYINK